MVILPILMCSVVALSMGLPADDTKAVNKSNSTPKEVTTSSLGEDTATPLVLTGINSNKDSPGSQQSVTNVVDQRNGSADGDVIVLNGDTPAVATTGSRTKSGSSGQSSYIVENPGQRYKNGGQVNPCLTPGVVNSISVNFPGPGYNGGCAYNKAYGSNGQ